MQGNFPVSAIDNGDSRPAQPRMYMYSVSSNTKEMFQLTGSGENEGTKDSHELTVGSLLKCMSIFFKCNFIYNSNTCSTYIPLTNRVRGPYCKLRTECFSLRFMARALRAWAINRRRPITARVLTERYNKVLIL